jgi:hypothetical protein
VSEDNVKLLEGDGEPAHQESKDAKLEAQPVSDSQQPAAKRSCWQMGCGWWLIIGGVVGLIQALQTPQKVPQPTEMIGTLGTLALPILLGCWILTYKRKAR